MFLTFSGKPIHKARPRFARTAKGVVSYDPQSSEKKYDKHRAKSEMVLNGHKPVTEGPIHMTICVGTPYVKNASKAQKKKKLNTKKPDLDNYIKYYSDVLNQIAYHDDAQITSIYACKYYSQTPSVTVNIQSMEENMVVEHAVEYENQLTEEKLEYIVQKANKMGKFGKHISRVFITNDNGKKNVMFETHSLYQKSDSEFETIME